VKASDGLPARAIRRWSRDKLFYLHTYLDIFSTGMKKKWRHLNYIDLFCGPGMCLTQETGEEVLGSPLQALHVREPLTGYFFVDISETYIDALRRRVDMLDLPPRIEEVRLVQDDCNRCAGEIVNTLGRSLSVAFIDPEGLDITWSTMETLGRHPNIDLIVNFPYGAMSRNFRRWFQSEQTTRFDVWWGDRGWRNILQERRFSARDFLDAYKERLASLGYALVERTDEIRIVNTKNQTLYYLVFASKHPLGHDFWSKAVRKLRSGQLRLELALA